jgi:hypothetical protein
LADALMMFGRLFMRFLWHFVLHWSDYDILQRWEKRAVPS